MPHAQRRDRLYPENRQQGFAEFSGVFDQQANAGAERRERKDKSDDPHRETAAWGAVGVGGFGVRGADICIPIDRLQVWSRMPDQVVPNS